MKITFLAGPLIIITLLGNARNFHQCDKNQMNVATQSQRDTLVEVSSSRSVPSVSKDSLTITDSLSCIMTSSISIQLDSLCQHRVGIIPEESHVSISDSLLAQITRAHKIECRILSISPCGTINPFPSYRLPNKYRYIVKFLFRDPSNFFTDKVVYGKFHPDVCFIFYVTCGKYVIYQLDFGLKKWKLLDSNSQELCTADMGVSFYYFLNLLKELFPNDTTIRLLFDTLIK